MGFKLPENLPTDADGLAQLRAQAVDVFNEIYGDGTGAPTQDEFAEMKAITEAIASIDGAAAELSAADERATAAAEMAATVAPAPAAEETDEDEGTAPEDTAEPADDGNDDDGEEAKADEKADDRQPVTASGRRTRFADAANGETPKVPAPERGFRLTTSAQNFETGIVDSMRVAKEFGNLATGRAARVIGSNGRSETTLAYVDRDIPAEFMIGDEADAIEVFDRATDESRLPGGSLVAAGSWCAPSETMYDFLPTLPVSGLLSLPEVGVKRGGIKLPKEPDYSALYAAIGFEQTEAQAQAGTEKTCYEIPCGEFEESRLDAVGVCITNGILQDKAWPELTKKYIEEALRLHQHKINARTIGKIVAASTDVSGFTGVFGAAGAVLSTLELQVADMRARHRLGRTQSLEGMAPEWLLGLLRSDLAYRDEVLPERVTDQHIIDHFRDRGANLQFVADWQNDVIGAKTPAKAWPAEVKVALWRAGAWAKALEPVVNIGVTHDSTLLKTNKQIQLFTEDGLAVINRDMESRVVTIPVKVDGMVGLRGPVAAAAG
ncbi:major capsid protein [Corynebacterium hansenii]|uniref:Major capsid protein n=1 Tax=Corynebacterium hansenii TaxID=394964 RepID=A0ABV7ZL59_9CORY|nr:major capsid protein [Corynebacterium hansenii]WJY99293.1 hypothetical protein CHAN_03325 [Corynebacterium hansenii]